MAAIEVDYSCLAEMASYSRSLASELEGYANDLEANVKNKIASVTDGVNGNLADATYYVQEKTKELNARSNTYTALAGAIEKFSNDTAAIDAGVATKLGDNYNEFINNGHSDLKIEDWKAEFIKGLSDWKDKLPVLDVIIEWGEDVGDWFSDVGDEILHWYHCEGGKEIVDIALAVGGAVAAVLLAIAAFPISGFVALMAAIGAVIGVVDAVVNVGTSIAAYVAKRNGDPAWAQIYGNLDTASEGLRLWTTDNSTFNKFTNGAALIIDIAGFASAIVTLGDGLKKVGSYLNGAGNITSYFKTVKWSDGKILTNGEGVAQTQYTAQSIWRGMKSFVCDLPIDSNDTRGIRTILTDNLVSDFKYSVSRLNPKNGLGATLLFSGDAAQKQDARIALNRLINQNTSFKLDFSSFNDFKRTAKRTATNIKSYSRIFETGVQFVDGKFDVSQFMQSSIKNQINSSPNSIIKSIGNADKVSQKWNYLWDNNGEFLKGLVL